MTQRSWSIAVVVDAHELQNYRPTVLKQFNRAHQRLKTQLGPRWEVGPMNLREETGRDRSDGRNQVRTIKLIATCVCERVAG